MTARLLVALLAALSCSEGASTPVAENAAGAAASAATAPIHGGGEDFGRVVDDFFDAKFAFEPSNATGVGIHEYDAVMDDRSQKRIDARIGELERFLVRLGDVDRAELSFDEDIDAQALLGQIQGELLDMKTLRVFATNPMIYAGLPGQAIDSLMKRGFAPGAERLASVVGRLQGVPGVYAAARANLHDPPREFTDLAIRMAKGSIGFFESSVPTWVETQAADADPTLRAGFEAANRDAVAATRDFAAWLEKDLLPRSKGSYAIGEANFLAKLKHEDMVEMPLADLLAKGEARLAADHAAFVEVAARIDPEKTPAQVMTSLSDTHPAPGELIASVRESVEDARRFLVEKDIITIPSDVRPIIEETPVYDRVGSFASMDTPGPFETRATEAFYYVTPVEKEWTAQHGEEHLRAFNPWVTGLMNVHEAYPGHYLQFLYAPRFPTKTRKLVFSGTNGEGWAHYCEQMMVDEGFGGDDPRYRLAQLQEALLRDARYVVGIKLHTAGWTVEQGARFFEEKAFQEPANAFEESRRGTYNPTYLYYTLGKLQIQELRDKYRSARGATLRNFHDAFVAQGALPIPLVERILFRERGQATPAAD